MADETKNPAAEAEKQETPAAEAKAEESAVTVAKADEIEPGMVVRVHQKVRETNTKGEERDRIQVFEGTVIAKKGKDAQSRTITVRKIASGVGVERIFPVKSTAIAKIEIVKQYAVRRAKLYYMRDSKKKLKEKAVAK
jgi:large subunit ribosomal protein L19